MTKRIVCAWKTVLLVFAALIPGAAADANLIFSDNWTDLTVQGPVFAASGTDWSIENGGFSADAATPPGSFLLPQSGRLMLSPDDNYLAPSRISVNFGSSAANTPVEARFKLHQTNAGIAGYRFAFGLKDTASGKYYHEEATTVNNYYGTSGFSIHNSWGEGAGTAGQCLSAGQWDYLKMRFDPAAGAITLWQAIDTVSTKAYDDASLTYTMVATWSNWQGGTSVDQFYLNGQGGFSWMVDDLEITGTMAPEPDPWVRKAGAIQTIYQGGVPHTDKNGNFRLIYDPELSFLPVGHYAAWVGTRYDQTWTFTDFANAGFKCCMPWLVSSVAEADAAHGAGIQLILTEPNDSQVNALKNHPATLAWRMYDEPTGQFWSNDMEGHYQSFLTRKAQVKAMDPAHPFYTLDCGWIIPPATEWFTRWNTAGDLTSHDNYPLEVGANTISHAQGIPETVSLAVSINNQNKPMWFVAQAFGRTSPAEPYNWRIPTPAEERCMVYTSLIHGATGVVYFVLDTYISREAGCLGMAPDPKLSYGYGASVTNDQLQKSRALWHGVVQLNNELAALRPSILSPTSSEPYEVYVHSSMPSISQNPIRTLLKTNPAGGLILLLANVDGVAQKVRIRFPNKKLAVQELYGSLLSITSEDYIELDASAWDTRILGIFDVRTIVEAKSQADGVTLACSGIVSAVFTDCFYIENSERTYGIRVNKASSGLVAGRVVNVTGSMQTLAGGERCIAVGTVDSTAATGTITPLGMTNRSLGGGPLNLQAGVAGATGLNNIGLLIKTTGKVGEKGTGWFMIDDGSGVSVKVFGTAPSGTPYVAVTGASSCEKDGSGNVQRAIYATHIQETG